MSGERLAEELHCTRAAIWKAVKSLRENGYAIEAGQNRGYCLSRESNRLSEEGIRLYLKNPETAIQFYEEIDSTNRAAKQAAISGTAGHGDFVVAKQQTAGRGRRGRSFFSPEESGIYLSILLEPGETLQGSLLLTTTAATAVHKAVEKVCGISLGIKWVNDLYRNGKKVCGILTEAITDFESGNIEYAIVGIGLNLFVSEHLPEELAEIAGGLFDTKEDAQKVDRNLLIAEIVNILLEEAKTLRLSETYVRYNIIPGHPIQILDGERSRRADAIAICEDGRLLIREENGEENRLSYGEVSVREIIEK